MDFGPPLGGPVLCPLKDNKASLMRGFLYDHYFESFFIQSPYRAYYWGSIERR